MVSLNDLADRPPVPLADGEVIELGEHRVRHIDTPHVPHAWEARVLYEETTKTLLCGDLFTQLGNGPALTTDDIIGAAGQAEDVFGATCLTPNTAPTIRRLADLGPTTLAVMHGSCYSGDGSEALLALADDYETRSSAPVESQHLRRPPAINRRNGQTPIEVTVTRRPHRASKPMTASFEWVGYAGARMSGRDESC